jgi:hypothetical protein
MEAKAIRRRMSRLCEHVAHRWEGRGGVTADASGATRIASDCLRCQAALAESGRIHIEATGLADRERHHLTFRTSSDSCFDVRMRWPTEQRHAPCHQFNRVFQQHPLAFGSQDPPGGDQLSNVDLGGHLVRLDAIVTQFDRRRDLTGTRPIVPGFDGSGKPRVPRKA